MLILLKNLERVMKTPNYCFTHCGRFKVANQVDFLRYVLMHEKGISKITHCDLRNKHAEEVQANGRK
jgi:hypothetical protein